MKNRILLVLSLTALFTGCVTARTYREATSAEYIGHDQYQIYAYGNRKNFEDEVQHFFYAKAFEVCKAKNMGFKVVNYSTRSEMVSVHTTRHSFGYSSRVRSEPRTTGVVQCEGPIDPQFLAGK